MVDLNFELEILVCQNSSISEINFVNFDELVKCGSQSSFQNHDELSHCASSVVDTVNLSDNRIVGE